METKICTDCKQSLPVERFSFMRGDRRRTQCKDCVRVYRKKWYQKNVIDVRESNTFLSDTFQYDPELIKKLNSLWVINHNPTNEELGLE